MMISSAAQHLRAGVIGAGFMGATHARAIRAAGSRVVAAVGSLPSRADAAAHATHAELGLSDVDELLARSDVDVVHICTPNSTHEDLAVRALEAGKMIVCEKPMATTVDSAHRVVQAAATAGLVGAVPFVYRYHPMVRELRARIHAGEVGAPSVVHGSYLQDWLASAGTTNWRVDANRGGPSRAFADIGSHWFDLFEFVTGDTVCRLSAQVLSVFPYRGGRPATTTEDAVSVQFATAAGVIGTMVASQVAAGRKNRLHLEISGTESSFSFDQEKPDQLWRGRVEGGTVLVRDPAHLSSDAARLAFLPGGHSQGYQDAFNAFVVDSYARFSNTGTAAGDATLPTLTAGLRAAALCDAVMESARLEGAWTLTPMTVAQPVP
jgi:predicted dehydrogenase